MYESWKKEFEGKKICIWGYGIEGKSTYAFIRKLFPEMELTIADGGKGLEIAKDSTVHTICINDKDCDFSKYDLVMKAPGIVLKDNQSSENISGEAQLFLKHYRNQTIGITGTKGKSTTTSLVHALLSEKYKTVLVGNIGVACFDAIDEMENGAYAAFEISCHQLEYCQTSPHIGVYLNLFEEHLDHYGSFIKYGDAKFNNIKYMQEGDIAIMHEMLDAYGYLDQAPVKTVLIGKDIYAHGTDITIPNKTLSIHDCSLKGEHNYQNLAVAWYIADALGIDEQQVLDACRKFHPLHHRLEYLGCKDSIHYVNDSISTIGQACIQALQSIDKVDVVLVGGMDRGIDYQDLERYLHERNDVQVIFMYATGHRIYEEMKEKNLLREHLYEVEDLKQAMELAKKICRKDYTILLSPAASSYDHFKNFEERGDVFKELAFHDA